MHKTSHNTMDDHFIIHTTSALFTFPSLISIHYRIVRRPPPSITHWPTLLSCTFFSTCSSCTSVHILLLLFDLQLTWWIHFVLHCLNGNLSAISIFGTMKGIMLQSIWPSLSHPATHVPSHITSLYPCAHGDHIQVSRSHPANLSQILSFHFQHFRLLKWYQLYILLGSDGM